MHEDFEKMLRDTVGTAITASLRDPISTEPFLVWKRTNAGQWHGSIENKPCLRDLFHGRCDWDALGSSVDASAQEHHPELLQLTGTRTTGQFRIDGGMVVRALVGRVYESIIAGIQQDAAIDLAIQRLKSFMDEQIVALSFIAPLINFRASANFVELALPLDVQIRRLSDEEVTVLNGGPLLVPAMDRRNWWIDEFAFVGSIQEQKLIGNNHAEAGTPTGESPQMVALRESLNKAILALRTFKCGPVGFDQISFRSAAIFPGGRITRTFGDAYVPMGNYFLGDDEALPLSKHAALVMSELHPSLDMACTRLADGEIRLNARDRLLDAVIGLESILLSSLGGKEEYRGETRYRFSIHYAALATGAADRQLAFRKARDLYDLRSLVAHGGSLPTGLVRLGREKVKFGEAATESCNMLRATLSHFLPRASAPPFLKPDFWDGMLFGVDNDTVGQGTAPGN